MDTAPSELVLCPHCGASNFAVYEACVACKRSLTVVIGPKPRVRQLSLGSVMMIVAVAAVCLAPIRIWPGISAILALILIPATTRAILHVEGRRADGRPMITHEKVHAYVNSVAVVAMTLLAASAAFVATCFPTGYGILSANTMSLEGSLAVACCVGAIPALYVIYRLGKRLWPRKD
jgi:hypothetical protein